MVDRMRSYSNQFIRGPHIGVSELEYGLSCKGRLVEVTGFGRFLVGLVQLLVVGMVFFDVQIVFLEAEGTVVGGVVHGLHVGLEELLEVGVRFVVVGRLGFPLPHFLN